MTQPMPAGAPAQKNNGLAITSLVLGILSFVCLGCVAGIPAVICGHMALGQINRSGGLEGGKGLAMAGLILGYINIGISLLLGILWALGMGIAATSATMPVQ